jgi:hypothetical protein
MAVCKFCGDGYHLAHEDLAPGGRLEQWWEHEGELIRRGQEVEGAYDADAPFEHWAV